MRVFLIGYPSDIGGAGTEAWHTIKLWRKAGLEVSLIPTWHAEPHWRAKLDAIGCATHEVAPRDLEAVSDLAGAPVVGFCNGEFLLNLPRFRRLGCPTVWVNCMTFVFDNERRVFAEFGPPDACVFQSQYQRAQLEPQFARLGVRPESGHLIRGAFDMDEWEFRPRPHAPGEPFVIGRAARPDADKWSSNTWRVYERISYARKHAVMLGMNERTHGKTGRAPAWATCLRPNAMTPSLFFRMLHCTLPINGGARENWPRAGLEAMAAGVPVVAQNDWGWREMIDHGVTGFLGSDDCELAHFAAVLAHDEDLRMRMVHAARARLVDVLANPETVWAAWKRLFERLQTSGPRLQAHPVSDAWVGPILKPVV